MNQKWLRASLASGLVLGMALAGCVVVPDQRHYADGVVMVAPPAPRVEVIGVAPEPGYVWVGGYWNWVGGRHEWIAGPLGGAESRASLGRPSMGAPGRWLAHEAGTLGARLAETASMPVFAINAMTMAMNTRRTNRLPCLSAVWAPSTLPVALHAPKATPSPSEPRRECRRTTARPHWSPH